MVERLEATTFTTLPEELHYRGEPTAWSKAVRPGKRIHSFLEGPSFDRNGNLYVSDTPHGRIFRVDSEGHWHTALDYDGQPNGLAIHRDGRLFVADFERGILELDPVTGALSPACNGYQGEPFAGCSDLVFKSNGDLYFTDAGHSSLQHPTGCVYRRSADGRVDLMVSGVPYPNGVAWDPSESELFVAATRANAVWKFAPEAPGARMVGTFLQLSGGLGPDGLAVDAAGRLAVAHARNGIVWVIDGTGEPVYKITTPGKSVTNVAYGGGDNKSLYITEADDGAIHKVELDTPGLVLFSHQ
jgi:gluconolactonase